MTKNRLLFWVSVLLLGWLFDFLFWGKPPGISCFIFVLALTVIGFLFARWEHLRPSPAAVILVIPVILFAGLSFLRLEPFSRLTSMLVALFALGGLAQTFLGGKWPAYSLIDHAGNWLVLAGSSLSLGGIKLANDMKRGSDQADQEDGKGGLSRFFPALRGILLALPVLLILTALLSSADIVFSKRVADFFRLFRIEELPETFFRVLLILFLAYLFAGIYLHALTKSLKEVVVGINGKLFAPFLGMTEAGVVLGSVNLLFISFVIVQFQYFFGADQSISIDGFTYSEYARRGFGELLVVACFSLLLFLGLSAVVKRDGKLQKRVFSSLGGMLFALVAIILSSAFQRLMLYEEAYGFTRLRTYTHVFMVWVGVFLLTVVVLELLGKLRFFALAAILVGFGFTASLSLLNVDSFIARQNIARAAEGEELDVQYLASLSFDAVPELAYAYQDQQLPEGTRAVLAEALACKWIESQGYLESEDSWQSFNVSRYLAEKQFDVLKDDLSKVELSSEDGWVLAERDGEIIFCSSSGMGD